MATGGWGGVRPELLEQQAPRRGRRTIDELVRAEGAARWERDLLAEVTRVLDELVASGALLCWYHRPDRAPRERDRERPGLPDLVIGVRPDLVIGVELKRPDGTGRLRHEQETWLRAWGTRGCLATSLAEVLAHLRRWGVVR